MKKDFQFSWGDNQQNSFEILKEKLMTTPILQYPDFSLPFILYTDASGTGLGAVLAQKINKKDHVIAYASRSMSKPERNYSITDQECLAVVWGIQHFHHYLISQPFTVVTDHSALKWLQTCKIPNSGRRARWIMHLQSYKFEIQHRPGKSNTNADALSRMYEQYEDHEISSEEQEVHCLLATTTEDKKGKGRAEEILVNLEQLGKFYARKFEDTHLDKEFDKPMGSVQHDTWEKPFQQQDWEPVVDEQKYTYEQDSWGEPMENSKGYYLNEKQDWNWESDNDWGNNYPNENVQQQRFLDSDEFIRVTQRGDDSYAYGYGYNTENLQQLYSQNIAIRQVIGGQSYTSGNGQCDGGCDTMNHHIHTYCRVCKRNLPYGTTIHQCNVPSYNHEFVMNPEYLNNQPWWDESLVQNDSLVESLAEMKENINRQIDEIYRTPGLKKVHINFRLVVDEQQ